MRIHCTINVFKDEGEARIQRMMAACRNRKWRKQFPRELAEVT
jgi:hypothetical protein